ncbi:MAG: phosphomannomutase/phosphoglucomutase [Pseudomonadota bacterium]
MAGIFKAYDIRGIYGDTLTDDIAHKIGRAFVQFLQCERVVVGRDMRAHSDSVFNALATGLMEQGADVIDIGLSSTPMCYFANGKLGADASMMITASHNPGEWNGFKLCRAAAVPISGATGIAEIEALVEQDNFSTPSRQGQLAQYDINAEYAEHISKHADVSSTLKIAVDYANAMGIVEHQAIGNLFEQVDLFSDLDGNFPNHEANPLNLATLQDVQQAVVKHGCDFGIAYDGDADRVGFVDENGDIVSMDFITALIAKTMLQKKSGNVLYDLRSSRAVAETIQEGGGTPIKSRVGHAFIKQQMREHQAIFAGELSGHYYFEENYCAESAALAVILIANLISQSKQTLSSLIAPIKRYSASGEINSTVADSAAVFERIRSQYAQAEFEELDGLTVIFDGWWFNVRSSNTEPLIRLNLEADDEATMARKTEEVLALIRA